MPTISRSNINEKSRARFIRLLRFYFARSPHRLRSEKAGQTLPAFSGQTVLGGRFLLDAACATAKLAIAQPRFPGMPERSRDKVQRTQDKHQRNYQDQAKRARANPRDFCLETILGLGGKG